MVPRNPQASYYRARYYDPNVGRFLGEDPIGFANGTNLFAYVHNRVTNLTDPFGYDDRCPSWVPNWACSFLKGPPIQRCSCERVAAKPQPARPSNTLVCYYNCDCSPKRQVVLWWRILRTKGCEKTKTCPISIFLDVDTSGASNVASIDPSPYPSLDPP